jgi:hypothetical protein
VSINPAAAGSDEQSNVAPPQDCATPLRLARSPFPEALAQIPTLNSRVRNPQDNLKEPDSGVGCTEFLKVSPCLGVGLFNDRPRLPLILDQPQGDIICSIQMRQENFWFSPMHSKGDGLYRRALRARNVRVSFLSSGLNDETAGAMSRRKSDERELGPTVSDPETSVLPLSRRPIRFLRGPIRHAIP